MKKSKQLLILLAIVIPVTIFSIFLEELPFLIKESEPKNTGGLPCSDSINRSIVNDDLFIFSLKENETLKEIIIVKDSYNNLSDKDKMDILEKLNDWISSEIDIYFENNF